MRHKFVLAFAFAWTLGIVAAAQNVSEWKFRQEIRVDHPAMIKLELPEETLDSARSGLEDLRILSVSGAEVPYLVERVHPEAESIVPVKRFQVQLERDATVVLVETGMDRPMDAIQIETSANDFIKAVRVESSSDEQKWTLLLSGAPLFRRGGEERTQIGISAGNWKQLRITIDDSKSVPVPVSGIRVHPVPQPVPESPVAARLKARGEEAGITRLELELGARNLTLGAIRIQTSEPLFTRNVHVHVRRIVDHVVQEQTIASGTISRVAVEGQPSIERLDISVEAQVASRELLLLIENQGSPPVPVESVTATRRPVYVMFLAKDPGVYTLFSGNARSPAPAYDLSFLSGQLNKTPVTKVAGIGGVSANPAYHPAEALPELAHSSTPLDVSAWKFRKKVNWKSSAVQEMDLDLEVLSHARNDYSDLRLIQQEKQFPYLLENASGTQSLKPSVTSQQDPRNPHLSRWILKLPYSSLPVIELTCRSNTPLFRRSVRLFERVADQRGSLQEHSLGRADWVQSIEDHDRLFLVSINDAPRTDTLILETDNGDNPPLQLQQFVAYYPITRLLFKPPAAGDVYLYYGNEKSAYPQYDIELAAQQLLESEKSEAMSGAEERLKAPGFREQAAERAGLLFWIALAVAVLALFFVVSRLLPKAQS